MINNQFFKKKIKKNMFKITHLQHFKPEITIYDDTWYNIQSINPKLYNINLTLINYIKTYDKNILIIFKNLQQFNKIPYKINTKNTAVKHDDYYHKLTIDNNYFNNTLDDDNDHNENIFNVICRKVFIYIKKDNLNSEFINFFNINSNALCNSTNNTKKYNFIVQEPINDYFKIFLEKSNKNIKIITLDSNSNLFVFSNDYFKSKSKTCINNSYNGSGDGITNKCILDKHELYQLGQIYNTNKINLNFINKLEKRLFKSDTYLNVYEFSHNLYENDLVGETGRDPIYSCFVKFKIKCLIINNFNSLYPYLKVRYIKKNYPDFFFEFVGYHYKKISNK